MRKIRIGFVAEPYEEKNASGMGHVVVELINGLLEQDKKNDFIIYSSKPFNSNRLSVNARNIIMPGNLFAKIAWFFRLKNDKKCDALFFIAPLLPFILPKDVKSIMICQELASQKIKPGNLREKIKAFLRDRILMPISVKKASLIIAASEATRKDILKFYKVKTDKIKVIYNGYQKLEMEKEDNDLRNINNKPYFFFAGKVKYRKNVHGIAQAFIKFMQKHEVDCELKIAGSYGGEYYEKIVNDLKNNQVEDKVKFLGYADKAQMFSLYKNCVACLFPSINEGFGMPIVEAMSLGAPVITSNISSMAEVADDAGILVDPFNIDQLADFMWDLYSNKELRTSLIKKGYSRSRLFSWDKAVKEYLECAYDIIDK